MSGKFISIFAGCGGSSLGYKMAGFEELLAIDFDKNAVETYKLNFDTPVWCRDITKINAEEILNFCNINKGDLDVLDGSPPCQGFSVSGARNVSDVRNSLVFNYINLIKELQPKCFVMENVPGMAKGKMKGIFNEIMKELKTTDYKIKCKLMNTKYYNVPQARERLIWIGMKDKEPVFPTPNINLIKIKDIIPEIEQHCRGQFDEIKKSKNTVAYTITKSPTMYFIKDQEFVTPTINELKQIMSFPVDFKFHGSFYQQWARIGNAVPPLFMKEIALKIKETLYE